MCSSDLQTGGKLGRGGLLLPQKDGKDADEPVDCHGHVLLLRKFR